MSKSWNRIFGVAVLLVVTLFFVGVVGWRQWSTSEVNHGRQILRIGYNLTDPGVAQALRKIADAYEAEHESIQVVLQSVPPSIYERWLVTQAAGETIPDLVHIPGVANKWADFAHRHLIPLSEWISHPNPYRVAESGQEQPWRDDFLDRLGSGFFLHMMEYYRVPLALNSTRLIVNLDLLKKVTGADVPPTTFRELLAIGDEVERFAVQNERSLVNLAVPSEDVAGRAEGSFLFRGLNQAATSGLARPYDYMLIGGINSVHNYYGLTTNTFSFDQPRIRAMFGLMRRLSSQIQAGWTNYSREDTRMYFLSEQALFTIGNTWDFQTLKNLAEFRMATLAFPRVEAMDAEGNRVLLLNAEEGLDPGIALGVTRSSQHQDVAIDFIQFCTTRKNNTELCRELGWYPAVTNEAIPPEIAAFKPHPGGAMEFWSYIGGYGEIRTYFIQKFPVFLNGGIDYDAFMQGLSAVWRQKGWEEIRRLDEIYLRGTEVTERNVALEKARILFPQARRNSATGLARARSHYALGMEIMERLQAQIANRAAVAHKIHTADPDFKYPAFPEERGQAELILLTESDVN